MTGLFKTRADYKTPAKEATKNTKAFRTIALRSMLMLLCKEYGKEVVIDNLQNLDTTPKLPKIPQMPKNLFD